MAALVALRLSGWSRGALPALLLVGLPLTLLPSWLVAALGLLRRDRLLAGAGALLVLAHVLVVLPGLGAQELPDGAREAPRLRVVAANVLASNARLPELTAALRALEPDVLVVSELRPRVLEALQEGGLLAALPHRAGGTDVGLLSRVPLRDVRLSEVAAGLPQPSAVLEVGGVAVRVHGAHPLPPLGAYEADGRAVLRALRADVAAERLPVVVAGDLNGDRDLPQYRDLLETGLRDAAEERGRGLSRTWPQRLPLLALDHVLVRDGRGGRLAVLDQREAALPGSDHLAVVADLAVLPDR